MKTLFPRIFGAVAMLIAAFILTPTAAMAEVTIHFYSFKGSPPFGRFPHAFYTVDGTRTDTGAVVSGNFGFAAKYGGMEALLGNAAHTMWSEDDAYIAESKLHFSMVIDDATFDAVTAETKAWETAPGKYYNLNKRNCVHFVGRIAEVVGLSVDYPKKMMKKPEKYLNHLSQLNAGDARLKFPF